MMCPQCGHINGAGAAVCERCGRTLASASSAIPFQPPSANAGKMPPAAMQAASVPVVKSARSKASRVRPPDIDVLCCVCGAITSLRRACRTCGTPPGLIANPGDPTGATFLPIRMLYPPDMNALYAVAARPLPPAFANLRWNWGAFGASLWWLLAYRVWGWALIVLCLDVASLLAFSGPLYLLIPYGGALLSLALGMQGYFLAWQKQADGTRPRFNIRKFAGNASGSRFFLLKLPCLHC